MILNKIHLALISLLILIFPSFIVREARAMQEENGVCKEIALSDIPVAQSDGNWHMPEDSMRMTQTYNNLLVPGSDAYCVIGISTPSWDNPACAGHVIRYRHTGNDFHKYLGNNGEDNVYSIGDSLVIASQSQSMHNGWGESVVYALRINQFTSEIITVSVHHMDFDLNGTSRKVTACDQIKRGDVVGLVGDTGDGPTHLHVNIRRWGSLKSLIAAIGNRGNGLFGFGYAKSDTTYLPNGGYREPISFLYNEFSDYKPDVYGDMTPYQEEMWPYVRDMLTLGIDTGLYDGRFGEGEELKRGEAARWIKVAAMRPDITTSTQTYSDIDPNHEVFPYVEALTRYPEGKETVLNPDANIQNGNRYFYPDQVIGRAPALKMMILAFYADEYQKFYKNFFWLKMANLVPSALATALSLPESALFQDVDIEDWYAPYVYFGAIKGFVAFGNTSFRPGDPIMREEMAKWTILGRENVIANNQHACAQKTCLADEYCDFQTAECMPKAECVSTETQQCEVGGGFTPCFNNTDCTPGETTTQSCGNGGTQTAICTDECLWGSFGDCIGSGNCSPGQTADCGNCGTMTCDSNYNFGSCTNEGACTPGQTQSQSCNGTGIQTRTCESTCQWGTYSQCTIQQVCTPGQTQSQTCTTSQGQPGTQTRTCDPYGQWGTFGSCTSTCACASGVCCDGCNYKSSANVCDGYTIYQCAGTSPGQDAQKATVSTYCSGYSTSCSGQTSQSLWQTSENCTSSEVCEMQGSTSHCVPYSTCTDTYKTNNTQSCKSYTDQYGTFQFCLNVHQISNALWEYQVCRGSGTFTNQIKVYLYDQQHTATGVDDTYTGAQGQACTPWRNIDLSYITQYGSSNGAGLFAEVKSPSSCIYAECTYNTGTSITVSLVCE